MFTVAKRRSHTRVRDKTVLIVDDNADNRELFRVCFEHAGFRVEEACDGFEALSAAAEVAPSAVILDLGMPGLDGFEVARKLKADERTRDIPLIACSGFAQPESQRRAIEAGCSMFLPKPCLPDDLVAAVQKITDSCRPPVTARGQRQR